MSTASGSDQQEAPRPAAGQRGARGGVGGEVAARVGTKYVRAVEKNAPLDPMALEIPALVQFGSFEPLSGWTGGISVRMSQIRGRLCSRAPQMLSP